MASSNPRHRLLRRKDHREIAEAIRTGVSPSTSESTSELDTLTAVANDLKTPARRHPVNPTSRSSRLHEDGEESAKPIPFDEVVSVTKHRAELGSCCGTLKGTSAAVTMSLPTIVARSSCSSWSRHSRLHQHA
jgi:hypothetical protein